MKLKTIGALLLSAQMLVAAQTINSNVAFMDGVYDKYKYEYHIQMDLLEHDLSHFQINVCDNVQIFNPASNVNFQIEFENGIFKFDNITSSNQPETIWFSFESPNSPRIGEAIIKAGRDTITESVYSPSCVIIPEPNTSMFGLIGMFMLLNRRKRNG